MITALSDYEQNCKNEMSLQEASPISTECTRGVRMGEMALLCLGQECCCPALWQRQGKSGGEGEWGAVLRAAGVTASFLCHSAVAITEVYSFPWCHLPHWNLFLWTVTTVHFRTSKEDFIQQKKRNICTCAHSPLPLSDNWTNYLVVGKREWKCSTWRNLSLCLQLLNVTGSKIIFHLIQ